MLTIDRLYGAPEGRRGFPDRRRSQMADNKIQGEGDYVSAKRYQKEQHEFAKEGPVEQKAREAEQALDSPEGEELEKARKDTGEGKTH
jgi:hypothetical protein